MYLFSLLCHKIICIYKDSFVYYDMLFIYLKDFQISSLIWGYFKNTTHL